MNTLDPMDVATQAAERPEVYFGRLEVNARFVVLERGQRPYEWHEGIDPSKRQTEVTMALNPLDESGLTRLIERKAIADSPEFKKITWQAARDLGVMHLREMHNRWVRAEMVGTGRSWANKEGQTVHGTTLKITAFYADKEKCAAAWRAEFGEMAPSPSPDAAQSNGHVNGNGYATSPAQGNGQGSPAQPGVGQSNGAGQDRERETALQFLPALVKAAAGNRALLAQTLANMPMISKYFTVDSPEVAQLLAAEAAGA